MAQKRNLSKKQRKQKNLKLSEVRMKISKYLDIHSHTYNFTSFMELYLKHYNDFNYDERNEFTEKILTEIISYIDIRTINGYHYLYIQKYHIFLRNKRFILLGNDDLFKDRICEISRKIIGYSSHSYIDISMLESCKTILIDSGELVEDNPPKKKKSISVLSSKFFQNFIFEKRKFPSL